MLTRKKLTEYPAYAWLVISLCACLLFYKYVLSVSPGVITDELMQEFQVSGAQLGNLAATFFYTLLAVQLFVGILLDKFGVRWLASLSLAVSALGALLFSQTRTIGYAELARGLMGFGAAFATVTYLKVAAIYFPQKQTAFVGGLLATAVMLGAVFGQAPLALMVNYLGWRSSFLVCAAFGLAAACVFALLVRERSPVTYPANKESFSWAALKTVLTNPQNWLLTLYSGLAFAPLGTFGGLWGNPFLREAHHLSRVEAASLISIMFLGLGLGSPIFGFISDSLGKRCLPMCVGTSLSLFTLLFVVYLTSVPFWVLAVLLFGFGFGTGAFMLCFALGRQHNSMAMIGTVIALINTGDGILGSLSEPLIGKFLDLGWDHQSQNGIRYFSVSDYHWALTLLLVYLGLALFLLYFIREGSDRKISD